MKYITEEDNIKTLNEISENGWENYKPKLDENANAEPTIIKINGTISEYAQKHGYVNAMEAMKIIEQKRNL